MIFYFTGTGNSRHAAQVLAAALGTSAVFIPCELDRGKGAQRYALAPGEPLGFVCPVYAWGPPQIVLDFIARLRLDGARPYVFSLCTCGGNEGRATAVLQRALARRGLGLDCAFTLRMPDNYVVGFDVDPPAEIDATLREADRRLEKIAGTLAQRRTGVRDLIPGKAAFLHTAVVHRLFERFARRTGPFYATDACTRCGLCVKVCPVHTITLAEKPAWGKACTQCLACLNRCPAHAIQYGRSTAARGRYVYPGERPPEK
jgi:ferredoxin